MVASALQKKIAKSASSRSLRCRDDFARQDVKVFEKQQRQHFGVAEIFFSLAIGWSNFSLSPAFDEDSLSKVALS